MPQPWGPKAAAWPQHSEGLRQVSFMNDPAQPEEALSKDHPATRTELPVLKLGNLGFVSCFVLRASCFVLRALCFGICTKWLSWLPSGFRIRQHE